MAYRYRMYKSSSSDDETKPYDWTVLDSDSARDKFYGMPEYGEWSTKPYKHYNERAWWLYQNDTYKKYGLTLLHGNNERLRGEDISGTNSWKGVNVWYKDLNGNYYDQAGYKLNRHHSGYYGYGKDGVPYDTKSSTGKEDSESTDPRVSNTGQMNLGEYENQHNEDLNKALNEQNMDREDSAYQRAFADITASGFNPLTTGNQASPTQAASISGSDLSTYAEHGFADSIRALEVANHAGISQAQLKYQYDSLDFQRQQQQQGYSLQKIQALTDQGRFLLDAKRSGLIDKSMYDEYKKMLLAQWQAETEWANKLKEAEYSNLSSDTSLKGSQKSNVEGDTALKGSQKSNVEADTALKGSQKANVEADTAIKGQQQKLNDFSVQDAERGALTSEMLGMTLDEFIRANSIANPVGVVNMQSTLSNIQEVQQVLSRIQDIIREGSKSNNPKSQALYWVMHEDELMKKYSSDKRFMWAQVNVPRVVREYFRKKLSDQDYREVFSENEY